MALRWTFRWELYHLVRLCGLVVEAEYSFFRCSGPFYGKELIQIANFPNVAFWRWRAEHPDL